MPIIPDLEGRDGQILRAWWPTNLAKKCASSSVRPLQNNKAEKDVGIDSEGLL